MKSTTYPMAHMAQSVHPTSCVHGFTSSLLAHDSFCVCFFLLRGPTCYQQELPSSSPCLSVVFIFTPVALSRSVYLCRCACPPS